MDLSFTVAGKTSIQSELLDRVTGHTDVRTELAMLEAPDGQLCLEAIKYHQLVDPEISRLPGENALGLGHLAFEVDDVDEIVASKQIGHEPVGKVQTHENIWKLY